MSKAKFKTGDLVQDIDTGEVEMLLRVFNDELATYLYPNGVGLIDLKYYRLISPKSVKFNLK